MKKHSRAIRAQTPARALSMLAAACAALCATSAQAQVSSALPETVVSASRFEESTVSLPVGVSVITAQDIRDSGATTVNEAIMRVLGVVGRLDSYGGGDYALDLRGFGSTADSNQVVILDGIRLNEGDLGGTRLAGIPIDSVERIEVMRGSGAVLYGEGATAGTIVITTKAGAGKERRNSASVYAGAGSHSLREVRGSATLAAGGFSADVSAQKRDTDNHRDNFRSKTDGAAVSAQWTNNTVRIGARYAEDNLDTRLPGSLSAAQYAANPRQTSTPNNWASIRNQRTGVFAEANVGGGWQLAADVGWREKSLRSFQGFNYAYDVDATNYALRARNESTFGSVKNSFVVGTDYGKWERTVLGAFGSKAEQDSRAWYVKDDLTLSTGTRLSIGARTERTDKQLVDSFATTSGLKARQNAWELGVSQSIAASTTVWGRVGHSFRLANADEFSYTNFGTFLLPQTSRDVEFGARWAAGAYKLEARAYRNELTNEIGYDPLQNFGFGANVNYDPTRRQGVELEGSWAASSKVNLHANLGLRQSTFRSGAYAGKDVPLAPRRVVALRADWTPADGHRLSGGVNWVSSQHPDFNNQCRMPAYTTVDARYAYQFKKVELALGVNNLFDRDYYTQAFSCSGATGITGGIYPEAGRTFTVSARVSF